MHNLKFGEYEFNIISCEIKKFLITADIELADEIEESLKNNSDKMALSDAILFPSILAFEKSVKLSAEIIKAILNSEEFKEKFYDEMYEEMKKRFKEEQKRTGKV